MGFDLLSTVAISRRTLVAITDYPCYYTRVCDEIQIALTAATRYLNERPVCSQTSHYSGYLFSLNAGEVLPAPTCTSSPSEYIVGLAYKF
jgi:hypothetical protein